MKKQNLHTKEINLLTSEAVWNQFSNDLKRYIFSHVKDEESANDILQEVFIKIHLKLDSLQKKESLKSWLFSITHNTIMNFFNKQKMTVTDKEITEESMPENDADSPENCLLPLINHLPEKYREPLLQSEIYGKKQAEVSEMLNLALSTTKSRIQRGRKLLQQGFMDCCNYKLNENGYLVGEHQSKEDCKMCK